MTQNIDLADMRFITGSGTPNAVVTAPKGSIFVNLTASAISTRMYINTDGGTTWTPFTTGA